MYLFSKPYVEDTLNLIAEEVGLVNISENPVVQRRFGTAN